MINELDLRSLWRELDEYEKELDKEAKSLEDVWVTMEDLRRKNNAAMEIVRNTAEYSFQDPDVIIGLNVGGQIFEHPVEILTRDKDSILASCCRKIPPFLPDSEGFFYFDRDWWLFRHIIAFLRSNILPTDLETLKELYTEASFYRLESLQRSIEDIPVSSLTNIESH